MPGEKKHPIYRGIARQSQRRLASKTQLRRKTTSRTNGTAMQYCTHSLECGQIMAKHRLSRI